MGNEPSPNKPRTRRYRRALRWLAVVIAVPLMCALYFWSLQLNDNFRTVVPGELYRSAQPDAAAIAENTKKYGIRSILNLRGDNAGSPWYDAEVAAANAAGVQHLNFRMSSKRELTPEKAQELIALLKAAPKPLWIHCHAGADRSGLAAAIYLAAIKNQDAEAAAKQLSFRYGHLPFRLDSAAAMDRSFDRLAPILAPSK